MAKEIEIGVKVNGLTDLRQQLKAARDEVIALQNADIVDEAKIQAATQRAGQLKDALNDANEQIAVMAGGSEFEKVSNGLGLIGGQLANMDFEGAAASAKNLTGVIKGMSPETVANGFKSMITTVGQLGKAFVTMGLQLLANPLFLLVAVVTAIVVAIVMLKDKIKIVEVAFNMLMAPINLVIDGLKKLSDWLGITQFEMEATAEASLKANEKMAASSKKRQGDLEKDYDRRIALMKAEGKDTSALEIEKTKVTQAESAKRVAAYNKEIATQRALLDGQTKEQQKATNEKINNLRKERDEDLQINRDAENQIKVTKAENATKAREAQEKEREKNLENQKRINKQRADEEKRRKDEELASIRQRAEAAQQLESQSYQNILAAKKLNSDALKTDRQKELDDTNAQYNAQIELARQFGQSTTDLEEARRRRIDEINKTYDDKKRAEDAAKFEEENAKAIEKVDQETLSFEERYAIVQERDNILKNQTNLTEEERARIEKENSEARIRIAQAELAAKTATLNAIGDALGGFTELVGKETAAGKALAIAQATISAYTGIANVWGAPSPYPEPYGTAVKVASTVAVATSAFANIKKIIATKVPGKAGGSGGSAPSGTGGASAPVAPALGLTGNVTQFNQTREGEARVAQAQQPVIQVRAVVSETEVTDTQNRVSRIRTNAEL